MREEIRAPPTAAGQVERLVNGGGRDGVNLPLLRVADRGRWRRRRRVRFGASTRRERLRRSAKITGSQTPVTRIRAARGDPGAMPADRLR